MTVLSGQSILRRKPIEDMVRRTEVEYNGQRFSYGCGPAGYDLRLDEVDESELSPNQVGRATWELLPGDFVLASAQEKFDMPLDLLGRVHDKSSWIRRGLSVHNTIIEPNWRGFLTLELKVVGKRPVTLYRGVGICQIIFELLDEPTSMPYVGKYQDQPEGPQEAI
jgi:dCTP deaminase